MKRFILAIILSPLIISFLASVAEPIFSGRTPNFKLIFAMLPLFYIFTLLGVIVFGLLVYFLFKKLNILNLFSLTIAGGLAGLIYMFLIQVVLFSKVPSIDIIELAPSGLMGAMSALISWGFIPAPWGVICLIVVRKSSIAHVLVKLIPRFRGTRKASVSERACPVGLFIFWTFGDEF